MAMIATGCLVTEEHEFLPELEVPSRISPNKNAPDPGHMIPLSTNADTLQLKVVVSDPNVDETLYYRVMLNSVANGLEFLEGCDPDPDAENMERLDRDLAPTGSGQRELTIPIERNALSAGCYLITLAISSRFKVNCEELFDDAPGAFDLPVQAGDVARASWWVIAYDTEEERYDIAAQCLDVDPQ